MKPIFESVSPVVYHATYTPNLLEILTSDKFQLSTTIGTQSDHDHASAGKFFFFSLSRVKHGGYNIGMNVNVNLVLDGTKLNQRYSGKAVDYWGENIKKGAQLNFDERKKYGAPSKSDYSQLIRINENEDRIFTTSSNIPNAKSYIREIHILPTDRDRKKVILDIQKHAGGIPVFVYNDNEAFKLLNKAKAVTAESITHYNESEPSSWAPSESNVEPRVIALAQFTAGIYASPEMDELKHVMSWNDWGGVDADIHNNRHNKKYALYFERIGLYMKKHKLSSIQDLYKAIMAHFRKIREDEYAKYQLEEKNKMEHSETAAKLDALLKEKPKPFYSAGDVNVYEYGGCLFYKDVNRIEAVYFDEDDENEINTKMSRVAYEDPATINWIDKSVIDDFELDTLEGKLAAFYSLVQNYGVENFGGDALQSMKLSKAMTLFPIDGVTGEAILNQIDIER